MTDYALELARRGHEVFPLLGKIPAIAGGNGCWDASHDPQVVRALWAARPHTNIGIHVAEGELIVDVDPRRGGDVTLAEHQGAHGQLPPTRTALTGRGDGGVHLTFQHPGGPITASGLVGIDLKQRGGYVVAPPSIHPDTGQPYRWLDTRPPAPLPAWFVQLIRPMTAPPRPVAALKVAAGRQLEGLVRFVVDSQYGERNNRLFWAACRGYELSLTGTYPETAVRRVLESVGQAIGLSAAEVRGTVASGFSASRVRR